MSRTGLAMLGRFWALMPRTDRFVELFTRHWHTLFAAADALRQLDTSVSRFLRGLSFVALVGAAFYALADVTL